MTPEKISETLSKIYYNPETGLQRAKSLFDKAKQQLPGINQNTVKQWLSKQELHQIFSHKRAKKVPHIQSQFPNKRWQIDLLDMQNQNPKLNHGMNYIMNCIDIYSRFVWSRPIKSKSTDDCVEAFASIIDEAIETPNQLDSDNEPAFVSIKFKALCQQFRINQHFSDPDDFKSKGYVERFNYTLRLLIEKYKRAFNTQVWYDVLQKLIANYNNTVHSITHKKPIDMIKENPEPTFGPKQLVSDFKVGDSVRTRIKKTIFEKGSRPRYSAKVFKIDRIEGNNYYVNGKPRAYKGNELIKVTGEQLNPIERKVESFDLEQHLRQTKRTVPNVRKEEKEYKQERRIARKLNQAGIDQTKALPRYQLRERAPSSRLKNQLIDY